MKVKDFKKLVNSLDDSLEIYFITKGGAAFEPRISRETIINEQISTREVRDCYKLLYEPEYAR